MFTRYVVLYDDDTVRSQHFSYKRAMKAREGLFIRELCRVYPWWSYKKRIRR